MREIARASCALALGAVLLGADRPAPPTGRLERDRYGGLAAIALEGTGHFRVERVGRRWTLVTPEGHPFYFLGVNHVTHSYPHYRPAFEKKYGGSAQGWAQETSDRLLAWGFTALGHGSAPALIRPGSPAEKGRLPYTVLLPLVGEGAIKRRSFPDVFGEQFAVYCDSIARRWAAPRANDPWCIGYFLGNELDLDVTGRRQWRSRWVKHVLRQAPGTPGREAFLGALREKYGGISSFNRATGSQYDTWEEVGQAEGRGTPLWQRPAFQKDFHMLNRLLARQFFRVAAGAVRRHDPHHLLLGCKFGSDAETEVLEEIGPYADVISLNSYPLRPTPPVEIYERIAGITGRPLLHTEFSYLQAPHNRSPAGATYPGVHSQGARGENYARFLDSALGHLELVGISWHEYIDPPDMNFGIVDVQDRPYDPLVERMRKANADALHRFQGALDRERGTTTQGGG